MNFLATVNGIWSDVESATVILFAIIFIVIAVWAAITNNWKD